VGVLIPEEVDTDRRLEECPTPGDLDSYASCVMYAKAREISDELQGVRPEGEAVWQLLR
jgi:hypothetical protein